MLGASGGCTERVIVPEWQQSVMTVKLTPARMESNVLRSQSSRMGFFQSRSVGHKISSQSAASSPSLSGTFEPWPEKCTRSTSPLRPPCTSLRIADSLPFFVAEKAFRNVLHD